MGQELSPDLQAAVKSLGLDPNDLSTGVNPDDPKVTYGYEYDQDEEYLRVNPADAGKATKHPLSKPVSEFIKDLYRMTGKERVALKQKLIRAGFLDPKGSTADAPDAATAAAYKQALMHAAQWNQSDPTKTFDEMMDSLGVNPPKDPGSAFKLTSAEDIAATARDAGKKILGRKLSDADLQKFVAGFQALELQTQQQAAALGPVQQAGQDVVVTATPTMENYINDQVRQANPGEAQAHDYSAAYNEFSALLNESQQGVKHLNG